MGSEVLGFRSSEGLSGGWRGNFNRVPKGSRRPGRLRISPNGPEWHSLSVLPIGRASLFPPPFQRVVPANAGTHTACILVSAMRQRPFLTLQVRDYGSLRSQGRPELTVKRAISGQFCQFRAEPAEFIRRRAVAFEGCIWHSSARRRRTIADLSDAGVAQW
jgi:hypothetical protein